MALNNTVLIFSTCDGHANYSNFLTGGQLTSKIKVLIIQKHKGGGGGGHFPEFRMGVCC